MIANLFGPAERKRHDCAILSMSGILQTLQKYSYCPNGSIFGDPAYPLRRNLLAPYNGAQLTQEQKNFNSSMSKNYRVSAILTNGYTCLYKSNVLKYFAIDPVLPEEYF